MQRKISLYFEKVLIISTFSIW